MVDTSVEDGVDNVGFLRTTKTDGVFAMYRVDAAVANYTFDVASYVKFQPSVSLFIFGTIGRYAIGKIRVLMFFHGGVAWNMLAKASQEGLMGTFTFYLSSF